MTTPPTQQPSRCTAALSTRYLIAAWLFFALSCIGYILSPENLLFSLSPQRGSEHKGDIDEGEAQAQENTTASSGLQDSLNVTPATLSDDLSDHPHFEDYAFDILTPHGAEVFQNARDFLSIQQQDRYQSYAQPHMCAVNVSHVLRMSGVSFHSEAATYSVPYFIEEMEREGGKVYILPRYRGDNRQEITNYINQHFPGGFPTGALVAGCTVEGCHTLKASQAHIAILGDKNHHGETMLYHNNWLRPSNLKGRRNAYMPSLKNYYERLRPRQWQATPWLRPVRNSEGQVLYFESSLPELDDLDPFNSSFSLHIILTPTLVDELRDQNTLEHHKELVSRNVHRDLIHSDPERSQRVCRSEEPMRTINARVAPGGVRHIDFYKKLQAVRNIQTFYHSPFEFKILEETQTEHNTWYSILVYDASRFWGAGHEAGEIWIKAENTRCMSKGRWIKLYAQGK